MRTSRRIGAIGLSLVIVLAVVRQRRLVGFGGRHHGHERRGVIYRRPAGTSATAMRPLRRPAR